MLGIKIPVSKKYFEYLSAEAMSKISLTPTSKGYEIEYVSRHGERFGIGPTKVAISPDYIDYNELVSLLKRDKV